VCAWTLVLALLPRARAELRGHGGPVRALAVLADGRFALSGSFDQSAILWSLDQGVALRVARFHDGAVNAAAALPDGRFVTAGEDGRLAIWDNALADPVQILRLMRARLRVLRWRPTAAPSPRPPGTGPRA
jgi:cytochrome c